MSDLIDRDKTIDVLDDFQSNVENCVGNAYAIARQQMIDIPSAEPSWADALAELHERFDALEKELRRASAEMSAIIRTNLDRPKGEWVWNENGMDWGIGCWCCSECGMRNPYIGSGDTALLSNPHNWAGSKYCPNCGADMRPKGDTDV